MDDLFLEAVVDHTDLFFRAHGHIHVLPGSEEAGYQDARICVNVGHSPHIHDPAVLSLYMLVVPPDYDSHEHQVAVL